MSPHVDDSTTVTAAAGLLEPFNRFIGQRGLATFLVIVLLAYLLIALDRRLEAQTTATVHLRTEVEAHAAAAERNAAQPLQLLRLVCLNTAGEARGPRDACEAVGR